MANIGEFEEEGVEPYEDAPYVLPEQPAPAQPVREPVRVPVPA